MAASRTLLCNACHVPRTDGSATHAAQLGGMHNDSCEERKLTGPTT